jgi:hypothetical protein
VALGGGGTINILNGGYVRGGIEPGPE